MENSDYTKKKHKVTDALTLELVALKFIKNMQVFIPRLSL